MVITYKQTIYNISLMAMRRTCNHVGSNYFLVSTIQHTVYSMYQLHYIDKCSVHAIIQLLKARNR